MSDRKYAHRRHHRHPHYHQQTQHDNSIPRSTVTIIIVTTIAMHRFRSSGSRHTWICKPCGMECFPGPSVPQAGEEPPAGDGGPRAARRRLRAKTPAMPSLPAGLHAAALAAEQEDDSLEPLAATVKRKHVHYAHVRTGDPSHVQPHQMSRPTPPPREQC